MVFSVLLLVLLSSSAVPPGYPQNTVQAGTTRAKDQLFTGTVMAVDEASLTVNRTVLGKNSSTKTFILTPDTKFEGGMPKVGAQVTVRYVSTGEGDSAIRVIVRRSPK